MRRASWLFLLGAQACGGEPITQGLEEPISIDGAQFREGRLPGRRPLTAEELQNGVTPRRPYATPPEVANVLVTQTKGAFPIKGRASVDTYAVALRIAGEGSGYWVLPVGAPDPTNDNELTWSALIDFHPAIPPGLHSLRIAAIDGDGNSGTQRELQICVENPIPDNLNVCERSIEPPKVVVTLGWDNDADLDLRVVGGDGSVIGNESISGEGATAGGRLDRDANTGCLSTIPTRESVVWQSSPRSGRYYVYVNLNDSCGERAAPFTVSIHVSEAAGDGFRQVKTYEAQGEVIAIQANGGRATGLFVTEFVVD